MGESNQAAIDKSQTSIEYKIGIIGPTRVGKTSLITALLEQGQELLAGKDVSIKAVDDGVRITKYIEALRSSLMADEFNPGTMTGTSEPTTLKLVINAGQSNLSLGILDYPGSWIGEGNCPVDKEKDWLKCQKWMDESIVLLVPVDAAVVMESSNIKVENEAAMSTLQIIQAESVVRSWAKGRIEKNEQGLLVLAPVKCETYFSDNGGKQDKSEDLFNRIQEFYQNLQEIVRKEVTNSKNQPTILIQYHPIDTIGCVEIKEAKWIKDSSGLGFEANYLVRPPRRRCPKGADGLLISICRQIVSAENNKKNPFIRFWRFLTGDGKKLQQALETLKREELGTRVKLL